MSTTDNGHGGQYPIQVLGIGEGRVLVLLLQSSDKIRILGKLVHGRLLLAEILETEISTIIPSQYSIPVVDDNRQHPNY